MNNRNVAAVSNTIEPIRYSAAANHQQPKLRSLCDVTDSENEFHSKYETVVNNIIHKKMSVELQKCLSKKSFSKWRFFFTESRVQNSPLVNYKHA